ncbi:hypothetical protein E2C01_092711 [Portunus trituberculatus]|uniref:Uncharacterized protein n=1 Tax=Portunus trituberculatus TaxID=210409 RepID=A0A5B7JSW8_PORTR|nr:hypothetical protein [Portunus trituberculatus]
MLLFPIWLDLHFLLFLPPYLASHSLCPFSSAILSPDPAVAFSDQHRNATVAFDLTSLVDLLHPPLTLPPPSQPPLHLSHSKPLYPLYFLSSTLLSVFPPSICFATKPFLGHQTINSHFLPRSGHPATILSPTVPSRLAQPCPAPPGTFKRIAWRLSSGDRAPTGLHTTN